MFDWQEMKFFAFLLVSLMFGFGMLLSMNVPR